MNFTLSLLSFLQSPSPTPPHTPERVPALLTLIYVGGLALITLLLLISLLRNRRPTASAAVPQDLSKDVRRRLGSTSTNRGLRALRWLFVLRSLAGFFFSPFLGSSTPPNKRQVYPTR